MVIPTPDPAEGRFSPVTAPRRGARAAGTGRTGTPAPLSPPRGAGTSTSPPPEPTQAGFPAAGTRAPAGDAPAAAVSPRASLAGSRTWTIELPAGMKLLSLNGRIHWSERRRRNQAIKDAAIILARQAKIPPLSRVCVVAEYQPPDRRRRDPDNIMAAAKSAIDGIAAAGVLPGDDSRYVAEVTCRIGEPFPKGRLVLHLTEEAA